MKKIIFLTLCACTARNPAWNTTPAAQAYGLQNAVALFDPGANRVVLLTVPSGLNLLATPLPVGRDVQDVAASSDGTSLFVLAAGKPKPAAGAPLPTDGEPVSEDPSLTIIDGSSTKISARLTLGTPLGALAVDPEGRWVVAYGAPKDNASFVSNPNALVIFDTTAPASDSNPVLRTLRSFGGTPVRLTFTPALPLPAGERRLLIVETDEDVALLDLDHAADIPERPEITVRLSTATQTSRVAPAGVLADDIGGATIAVKLANNDSVMTLDLVAPEAADETSGGNDFAPRINLTSVGGEASAIAFVNTDAGRRLLALVPATKSAVLVDPDTSATIALPLPEAYGNLSLLAAASGLDTALLWNSSAAESGIALLSLGQTVARPYDSVEVLGVDAAVSNVIDVPAPHAGLKILETANGGGLYVLDLADETASPLSTSGDSPSIALAPGDNRAWVFAAGTTQLSALDLSTLHPQALAIDVAITNAFDVIRDDQTHALVAIHNQGLTAATVFDAAAPDAGSRFYPALLVGGLP